MSDLIAQLEEWARKDFVRVDSQDETDIGEWDAYANQAVGGKLLLDLLRPVIEAADVKFYCNCTNENCEHAMLRDAIKELKEKLQCKKS